MNRDAIERLAIDSAAGELNEDAELMFQSYLAEHPRAGQWANSVRQTYDRTEAAIKAKTALGGVGKTVPRVRLTSPARWLSVARWAAAIALATIIGFTAGRREITGRTHPIAFQEPSRDLKPVENVADLKERYAGTFWGDKMLALLERQPAQQHEAGLPGLRSWDTYRQLMKERHYE